MLGIHHRALLRHPGDRLQRIDPLTWEGFCRGALPLTSQHGIISVPGHEGEGQQLVDILLLTLRQDEYSSQLVLELVEPFRLNIDEHGFLRRLHVNLDPLPDPDVIDLRGRLITGYLRRAYQWCPSATLIAAALTLCGAQSDTSPLRSDC